MAKPRLLLLDEPSLGLAPLVVRDIFQTIEAISKNPCARCGTYQLEKQYVGSGCCSEKCYSWHQAIKEPALSVLRAAVPVHLENLQEQAIDLQVNDQVLVRGTQMSVDGKRWIETPLGLRAAVDQGWFTQVSGPKEEDWDDIMDRMFGE